MITIVVPPCAHQYRPAFARPFVRLVACPAVDEWVAYMKAAGVQAVVSMLSPSELATYEQPLQAAMEAAFGSDSYINVDDPAGPGERHISFCLVIFFEAVHVCVCVCVDDTQGMAALAGQAAPALCCKHPALYEAKR